VKLVTPALVLAAFVFGIGLAFAACGQDVGDRCQVDSDCSGDNVCNQATHQCARPGGGGIDANLPIDAPAEALDAPPDAPDAS
jgi:hypothetical protein